ETPSETAAAPSREADITAARGTRSIVLVGMMGAGKSTIGRGMAARPQLPFTDADAEIETAHRMSTPNSFQEYGEPYFRDGEARVIARPAIEQPRDSGPGVLATGGGSFMHEET